MRSSDSFLTCGASHISVDGAIDAKAIDTSLRFLFFLIATWFVSTAEGLALLPAAILLGVACSGLISVFHDCVHYAAFAGHLANRIVGIACAAPVGLSFRSWRYRHVVDHHARPGHATRDGDIQFRGVGRVHPSHRHYAHQRWQHIYMWLFHPFTLLHMIGPNDVRETSRRGPGNRTRLLIVSLIEKYVPFVAFWVILHNSAHDRPISSTVAVFAIVGMTAGTILSLITQCQHNTVLTVPADGDTGEAGWLSWQLQHAADVAPTRRVTGVLAAHANLHVLHHLIPSISRIDASLMQPYLVDLFARAGIPDDAHRVHDSYRAAIHSHAALVHDLGRRP